MNLRILTAGLALAALVAGLDTRPADAQQTRNSVLTRNQVSPNVQYQQGPRTRIYVSKRSWLDAGTEVLPGERKFTDYAFPPSYFPMGTVTNTGGKVGWDNSPLPGPFDLRSPRNPYGW